MPRPEPTDAQLIAQAVADTVARPAELVDTLRHATGDLTSGAARLLRGAGALIGTVASGGAPGSGLAAQRRGVDPAAVRRRARRPRRVPGGAGRTRLHRERRGARGRRGRAADVVAVAGRAGDRGEPGAGPRAAVDPTRAAGPAPTGACPRASSTCPSGEPSPRLRLQHVAHAMREHTAGHRSVRARDPRAPRRPRPAHPARAGRPRRQRHLEADLQPGGDERARTAGPAVRRGRADAGDVPGGAAGGGPGPRDRHHLLRRGRPLRPQRRPRRARRRRRPRPGGGRGARRAADDVGVRRPHREAPPGGVGLSDMPGNGA